MKDFSRPTQIYILGTIFIAAIMAIWQFLDFPKEEPMLLLLASGVASILQGIAVFGTTARSTYSLSWIVYAFTLISLGPPATFIVVFVSHLAEWLLDKDRLKWYIQTFNIGNFFITFSLAGWVISWGETVLPVNSPLFIIVILFALALFTGVNHWLVGLVIKLARGQNLAQSGVFGKFTLLLDFTLLCLGVAAAIIWQIQPIALILIFFVTYVLFEALKIPALERKTEIDSKTELFNARYFTEALDDELVRAKRFKRPLSIIMADLDFLRTINNTYGHLAGDVVLQGVANILKEMTREYDIVARFGGEEFSVLLPETEPADAYVVAERIRERIEAAEFSITTSIKPIRATMSFGIAGRRGNKQTIDNLIHNADVALYQAKENGRNRTCVYDGQFDAGQETSRDWGKLGISVQAMPEMKTGDYTNGKGASAQLPAEKTADPFPEPTAEAPTAVIDKKPTVKNPSNRQFQFPNWAVPAYIVGLAISAFSLSFLIIRMEEITADLFGLLLFAIVVFIMEASSIEIYVRKTYVSTSAALLVAGVMLFGSLGAIVLGIVIAFVAFAKRRTNIDRFVFNASNHIIGGLLIGALLSLTRMPIAQWSLIRLLVVGAGAASLLYISTTLFLTLAIGLSSEESFKDIWVEHFRWLVPYYLALGVIAATLVFSYLSVEFTGILIVILPLLMLRYSQKQYIDHTETMVNRLQETNAKLVQKTEEIALLNEELLLTLARSLDLRDPHVMEHSKHVSRYAVCVAQELQLPPEQIENIRKAGLLHDIGKLGVREEILFKPGRLTFDEFELVKEHVNIGAELIRGCHTLEPLAPFVLYHHEWFNGQGYVHGLAGEEIPLEARILSLADAVEAMASDRPYKSAMSPKDILIEIQRCAGSQFDPEVALAFGRVIERQGEEVIVNSARNVLARQSNDTRMYEPHY